MERTPEKLRVRFALCQPTLGGAAFGIRLRRRVIFREKLHQLARILAAKRAHLRALFVPPLVIPGCAFRRRPGIHNPSPWLWIPGSRFRAPRNDGKLRSLHSRPALAPAEVSQKRLALGELERLAGLGAAVLLALDGAGVAGQEAALLQDATQVRLEIGQRLRDAVTPRARLPRQAAAGDRADHVILAGTSGRDQRLLDHHAQHRAGEVDVDLAGIDRDLAGTGLDPDAGDRVLALSGGIGAPELVDLLLVFRRLRRRRLELRELIERLDAFGHVMRPSCSCDSSWRYRSSRGSGLHADAPRPDRPAGFRAARGRAARAGSCARWPFRPPAPGSGLRGSTWRCVP